jgi:hypothetical protein
VSGIYDLTLAPGAAGNIAVQGALAKVSSAPAGAVTLKLDAGESFTLLEGQGVRLPDGKHFRDVQVVNRAATSQTVSVFVGDSRFEDTRITGVVSIVDAGKARTIAGQAFLGRTGIGVGAATFAATGLWNPAASPTRAVIEVVTASCSVAGNLYVVLVNSALTLGSAANSKKGGGSVSTALMQTGSNAAVGALDPGGELLQLANAISTPVSYTFKEPVVLPPGWGLRVVSDNFNSPTLSSTFEFFEEANT